MINNTLARRYAKALVQIGSEGGLIDRFRDELTAIERVFSANADLKAVFAYLRTLKPIQNTVPDPVPPSPPNRKKTS